MTHQAQQGPGSLFSLTWPLFIDIALHFATGAMNTFMMGQINFADVAALAVGNQVFDLAITVFSFVSIGSSVVLTQYLGAKRYDDAKVVIHSAIGFNLLIGLLAAIVILTGAGPILQAMNLPAHLLGDGQLYLTIIGLCLLPEAAALCLAATLRAHGHTRQAMYATLLVNLVTFISNLTLLYGWFGLPQFGVAGVAISTVIGRLTGIALLIWLVQKRAGIQLVPKMLLHPNKDKLRKVLRIGLPAAGENLSWMLQFMVITAFVGLLGETSLATHSYYFQICLFMMLFGISIGLGNEIIIGYLIGGRQFDSAYARLLKTLKLGIIVTFIVACCAAVIGRQAVSFFSDDATIIQQISMLFLISIIMEPGRTFNLVVINALRATGDARFPLMMALCSMWGIAVPLAYYFGIHCHMGLVGIWIGLVCDEWVRGLAMLWRWRSRRWQNKSLIDDNELLPQ
ncbi:MATE family efflux transporter [Shewanella avicenniae]|uniref:MATE family efflux transporter n=1 Tax=Shewanella avicenniae TaxID=2814294 RepID=A0ABX7QN87_9GAMM|nr:MATE family efflux transporter [Shewanella avicenniae]QSX32922.1 MATE family efflux transporter [Shewanella avicenniae]